jgi:hypothetical protein
VGGADGSDAWAARGAKGALRLKSSMAVNDKPRGRGRREEHLPFNYAVAVVDGRGRCKYCHHLIARGQLLIEANDERGSLAAFFCKHLTCSSRSTLRNALLKYGALEQVPGTSELGLSRSARRCQWRPRPRRRSRRRRPRATSAAAMAAAARGDLSMRRSSMLSHFYLVERVC